MQVATTVDTVRTLVNTLNSLASSFQDLQNGFLPFLTRKLSQMVRLLVHPIVITESHCVKRLPACTVGRFRRRKKLLATVAQQLTLALQHGMWDFTC